jgi:hypothetical protein
LINPRTSRKPARTRSKKPWFVSFNHLLSMRLIVSAGDRDISSHTFDNESKMPDARIEISNNNPV